MFYLIFLNMIISFFQNDELLYAGDFNGYKKSFKTKNRTICLGAKKLLNKCPVNDYRSFRVFIYKFVKINYQSFYLQLVTDKNANISIELM